MIFAVVVVVFFKIFEMEQQQKKTSTIIKAAVGVAHFKLIIMTMTKVKSQFLHTVFPSCLILLLHFIF